MKSKPEGSTYVDSFWGYVMQKHRGRWVRQHRLKMEQKLGRKLRRDEVVHHRNGDRSDNRLINLQILSDREHRSHHSNGRRWPNETKAKMSASAKLLITPEERARRSRRAKHQHANRRFGY